MPILEDRIQEFVSRLLAWRRKHRRSFPWRETRNPYRVLVAELMLHRTKAQQVVPVYRSFIENYPTPEALADTTVERIRSEISSLGLEYRATRLKKIAKILVDHYGGQVPSDFKSLRQLPGVGAYIANAVLCFAFGRDRPLLDTNVIRVIHRVFSIPIPPDSHKKKKLWDLMERIVPHDEAREFNLAILDLGALICKARKPEHDKCPLKDICDLNLSMHKF